MTNPSRKLDITWRKVGDEVVIYTKENQKIHVLNRTAMEIWILCDGNHSVEDIAEILSSTFNTSKEELKKDVARTIEDFNQLQLLQNP